MPEKSDIANKELYKYILFFNSIRQNKLSNSLETHKWNLPSEIRLLGFFCGQKVLFITKFFYHFIIYFWLVSLVVVVVFLSICWHLTP